MELRVEDSVQRTTSRLSQSFMKVIATLTMAAVFVVGVDLTVAQARDADGPTSGDIANMLITSPPGTKGFKLDFRTHHQKTERVLGGSNSPTVDMTYETAVVQWKKRLVSGRHAWRCTEVQRSRATVVSNGPLSASTLNRIIDGQGAYQVSTVVPGTAPAGASYADVYSAQRNQVTGRVDFRGKCPSPTTHIVDADGRALKETVSGWSWGYGILVDVMIGFVIGIVLASVFYLTPPGLAFFNVSQSAYFAVFNCIGAGIATIITGVWKGDVTKDHQGSFILGCIAGVLAGLLAEIIPPLFTMLQSFRPYVYATSNAIGGTIRGALVEILPGRTTNMFTASELAGIIEMVEIPTSLVEVR